MAAATVGAFCSAAWGTIAVAWQLGARGSQEDHSIATGQTDNPSKPVTHMSSKASTLLTKMTRMSGGKARPEIWRWLQDEPRWPGARAQVTTPQIAGEMRREGWGSQRKARDSATTHTPPRWPKACPPERGETRRRYQGTARAVSAAPLNRSTHPTLARASLNCPRGWMPRRLYRAATAPRSEQDLACCASVIRRPC